MNKKLTDEELKGVNTFMYLYISGRISCMQLHDIYVDKKGKVCFGSFIDILETDEVVYFCDFCDDGIKGEDNLIQHILKHIKNDDSWKNHPLYEKS